jgi:hypothetical protein
MAKPAKPPRFTRQLFLMAMLEPFWMDDQEQHE